MYNNLSNIALNVCVLVNNFHYKNWFFESQPKAGFQKTNFGVSRAKGAGNTKISLTIRISAFSLFFLELD
jgi:hypothetical protein